MSGKCTPKGPRALLTPLPTSSASATLTSPSSPPSQHTSPSSSKIGTAPPTGPRSLINGHLSFRHPKQVVHSSIPKPGGPGPSTLSATASRPPSDTSFARNDEQSGEWPTSPTPVNALFYD